MSSASLFARLERAADPVGAGRAVYRGEDLETVVLAHLHRMLNTRSNSSLSAPDYGMLELSDLVLDFPNAKGLVQRVLKNTIGKYEPRLKNVQVRTVEGEELDPMFVHFEVTAQLVHPDGQRQAVRFTTTVDDSSNVQLG
jgi:type VI secretion system protein